MEPPSTPPTFLISLLLLLLVSTAATTALAAAAANSSVSPPHPISPTTSPKPAPTRSHHISPTTSPAAASTTPSPATSPATSPTASPTPSSSSSSSALDPKQLRALQSLNIPFPKDPCSPKSVVTACDAAKPFRHLTSLLLANCSRDDVALSFTALKSLSTLHSLSFINCPVAPIRFPADLVASLRSFSCVHSLHRLTGVWLSRLQNLTDLTVSDVPVNASGLYVILGNMKNLRTITISRANVTGYIPKHWHLNISHIDLSGNQLKGQIPTSITLLENLELLNLSSNALAGEIPSEIGDLISLKNLSLASNSISGSVPQSMSAIPGLVHVDLSSNQLNGTIPKFLTEMKHLKYLNLEKNNFHGIMPFNESFINELVVFKIGDNSNLCYNHTVMSSKVKLGIAPCDKHGLPMSPPPAKGGSSADDSSSSDDYEADSGDSSGKNGHHHHGPNKVVLGFAIALSSIVFLIVFLVLLSRCCK